MLIDVLSNWRVSNCQHVHSFVGLRYSLQDLAALVEQASLVVSQDRQRSPSRSGHARCHRWQDCCVSHFLSRPNITISLLTYIYVEFRESTRMATSLIRSSTRQSAVRYFLPSTEPPCVANFNFTSPTMLAVSLWVCLRAASTWPMVDLTSVLSKMWSPSSGFMLLRVSSIHTPVVPASLG
jgi:hypothetical protein